MAGAIWGAIPGYLKAKFGAHEVVNTIMMNWIAFRLSDWLLTGPMMASGFRPVTPNIQHSAELPRFFAEPLRFNWGFVLAPGEPRDPDWDELGAAAEAALAELQRVG